MTRREYYVSRAVECALAADQIPCDRTVLLHLAATYVRIATEIELHQASRRCEIGQARGSQSLDLRPAVGEPRCDSAKTCPRS